MSQTVRNRHLVSSWGDIYHLHSIGKNTTRPNGLIYLGCENPIPTCKTLGGVSGSCYIQDFTTSAGGPKRKFIYHVPKNYDSSKPAPLIFSFHGHGKNAENQELLSQFSDEAYNQNAIAVYPDGLTTAVSLVPIKPQLSFESHIDWLAFRKVQMHKAGKEITDIMILMTKVRFTRDTCYRRKWCWMI